LIIKLGKDEIQLPPGYSVHWTDPHTVYMLVHVCGKSITSWNDWHLDKPEALREIIFDAMKKHDLDHQLIAYQAQGRREVGMPPKPKRPDYHQRHDFKAGATSSVCECGGGRDDIMHTMEAFTDDERQKMRDRIGADLIECGECGDLVAAETTSRVMKTHDNAYRNVRLCQLCIVPPAKRNPYTVLAVRLARGTITADQYEEQLEDLVRAQREEERAGES
jgi:hypothetical protein